MIHLSTKNAEIVSSIKPTFDKPKFIDDNYKELMALPAGTIESYSVSNMTSREWINYSVMKIERTNLPSATATPGSNTDPRLGAIRHQEICETCKLKGKYCSGHYAYIDLNCYIINPAKGYSKVCMQVYNCLCQHCGLPVIKKMDSDYIKSLNMKWKKKLEKLVDKCAGARCPHSCSGTAPNKISEADVTYKAILDVPLKNIHALFESLSDESLSLLLYNGKPGPSSLIISVLPVIPLRNRIAVQVKDSITKQQTFSKDYDTIFTKSKDVELDPSIVNVKLLCDSIEALYDNYKKTITDKTNGINRGEQEGKPTPCCSRAVIVPAPELPVTHGYVPQELADSTTVRMYVTEHNLDEMRNLMTIGKIKAVIPGGFNPEDPIIVRLGTQYKLEIGDLIDRTMIDYDITMTDRPPTLHEAGIVPTYAVVRQLQSRTGNVYYDLFRTKKNKVLGLHLSNTTPKAGDYDGDAITSSPAQSDNAALEMKGIQNLVNYMIDGQSQKAAFTPVQDAILGTSVATKYSLPTDWNANGEFTPEDLHENVYIQEKYTYVSYDTLLDYCEMLNSKLVVRTYNPVDILPDLQRRMQSLNIPFEIDGVIPALTLFSMILPQTLKYSNDEVEIKNGVVIKIKNKNGITGNTIGGNSEGLISHICIHHSREEAVTFVTDCTWIFTSFLSFRGYSISIKDNMPAPPNVQEQLDSVVIELYRNIEFDLPKEPKTSDITGTKRFWLAYNLAIIKATQKMNSIAARSVNPSNKLLTMIKSGAKGNESQLWNLIACVGQKYEMNIEPMRVMDHGTRRNYYFSEFDKDPKNYGYCISSYSKGLTKIEYESCQRGMRSDFIVMSQDTPNIGQSNRENAIVSMDMTIGTNGEIRDTAGLISPLFGGDGFNPMRLMRKGNQVTVMDLRNAIEYSTI